MRPQLRLVPQPRGAQGAALKRKLTSAAAEAARAAAAEACVDAGRALLERLLTKVRARPAPREGAPGQRRQPGSAATTLLPPHVRFVTERRGCAGAQAEALPEAATIF